MRRTRLHHLLLSLACVVAIGCAADDAEQNDATPDAQSALDAAGAEVSPDSVPDAASPNDDVSTPYEPDTAAPADTAASEDTPVTPDTSSGADADVTPRLADPSGAWEITLRLGDEAWQAPGTAEVWDMEFALASQAGDWLITVREDFVDRIVDQLGPTPWAPGVAEALETISATFERELQGQALDRAPEWGAGCAGPVPNAPAEAAESALVGVMTLAMAGDGAVSGELRWIGVTAPVPAHYCASPPHPVDEVAAVELTTYSAQLALAATAVSGQVVDDDLLLDELTAAFSPSAFVAYLSERYLADAPYWSGPDAPPWVDCEAALAAVDEVTLSTLFAGVPAMSRRELAEACDAACDAVTQSVHEHLQAFAARPETLTLGAATVPLPTAPTAPQRLGPWTTETLVDSGDDEQPNRPCEAHWEATR